MLILGREQRTRLILTPLAIVLVLSACKFREADDFNTEAAALVCRFNRVCQQVDGNGGDDLFEYAQGDACYDDFINQHAVCPDHCDYKAGKARKCIRKLEQATESCNLLAADMVPCQDVYDCSATRDAQLIDECGFAYSAGTCLCVADPNASAQTSILGLLFLIALHPRRRRRLFA